MKRIYTIMTMAVLLIAGGHCAFAAKKFKIIEVETSKFEKRDSTAEVSVLVQWPVKGDKAVVDSLRHHINYLLSGEINNPKDVQPYGESLFESLSLDWHSVYDDMEPEERLGAFTKYYDITLDAQTNRYVTYFYRQHEYQGGMHGYTTEVGFTFRKSDGKQIPLLTNTDSPQLAKLVKEGVKSFFAGGSDKSMSDEELLDYLFAEQAEDLDNLPLPGNAPYLSETGVVFLYTQYEIAPYSSGIITFEIPFADIRPFLTPEAQELIP
jgi:hypothetical protein